MQLSCESTNLEDYLLELNQVDFSSPLIMEKAEELFHLGQTHIEKAKIAYEFVRDKIPHSWDIQGKRVTCKASDVLTFQEGICYAKSNLLAALLRSQGIPTGFCYQRLTLFDTPDQGYCIHALNAVYLKSLNKWVRLDARGNKVGVNAQFLLEGEQLAFPVREELEEKDYPIIYVKPNRKTMEVLEKSTDVLQLYQEKLPDSL